MYKFYNQNAEKQLRKAGFDVDSYEKECAPYIEVISGRRDAMESNDIGMYNYYMSSSQDKAKHASHDKACNGVKTLNSICRDHGFDLLFSGDESNRQEIGKFVCEFTGNSNLSDFVD